MTSPRIVAIVGPTASGKSDLAMEIACRLNGEVVSCDSVQVYRGLDVGSGKPSLEDRARVPHHLVDILDVQEEMNAARFAQQAARAIEDIAGRGRVPIVTGGTGLYLTALLKGLFEQGESGGAVRLRLDALAFRHGSQRLHRLLASRDPEYASRTKVTDQVRVVRALEVWFSMGRRFSQVQQERRPAFQGEALLVGLDPGREQLRARVTARVDQMLSDGLVDETRRMVARNRGGSETPRPLGAIGYRQVVTALASRALPAGGDLELQRAIVTSTMQYAKRQMTYFRHQFEVEWFVNRTPAVERVEAWVRAANREGSQT